MPIAAVSPIFAIRTERHSKAATDRTAFLVWSVEGATVYITSVMSYVLLIIALAVLVPAGINHFFFARRSKRVLHKSGGSATTTSPAWSVWPRKWLFLPPLFKKHNSHRPSFLGFSVTIPTRFETVCIVIYLLVNALGCGLGIDPFKEVSTFEALLPN